MPCYDNSRDKLCLTKCQVETRSHSEKSAGLVFIPLERIVKVYVCHSNTKFPFHAMTIEIKKEN